MKRIAIAGAAMLSAALPAQALAADPGCTAYDAQAAAIQADLQPAFDLMHKRDIATASKALPALEAHFAKVKAVRPEPQKCGADILVYDHHQFLALTALQKAGKPTPGFAAGAHFVEKGLPFANLAYAVGWLKYEAQDFQGAKAAYSRGLLIAPNEHDITTEVAMTMMNLQTWPELIVFTDRFLGSDNDAPPAINSKMISAKAYAQAMGGDMTAAKASIALALKIDPENKDAHTIDDSINPKN